MGPDEETRCVVVVTPPQMAFHSRPGASGPFIPGPGPAQHSVPLAVMNGGPGGGLGGGGGAPSRRAEREPPPRAHGVQGLGGALRLRAAPRDGCFPGHSRDQGDEASCRVGTPRSLFPPPPHEGIFMSRLERLARGQAQARAEQLPTRRSGPVEPGVGPGPCSALRRRPRVPRHVPGEGAWLSGQGRLAPSCPRTQSSGSTRRTPALAAAVTDTAPRALWRGSQLCNVYFTLRR